MKRLLIAFVLVELVALAPRLGSSDALDRSQSQPTFRAMSAYVRVDFVATDANEKVIDDLRRDDIEILDGGERQEIVEFSFIQAPLQIRAVDDTTLGVTESPVVSNGALESHSRAMAIVVDETSLISTDFLPAQRVVRSLAAGLTKTDVVGLTYITRSDLGEDFTSNVRRIYRAIGHLGAAFGGPKNFRDVTMALRNAIQTLATAPQGRRSIVLIGRGWPAGIGGFDMQRVVELSRQTGVPIYTLDPSGLVAPELGLELPMEQQTPDRRANLDSRRRSQQSFLRAVATNTGGLSFVNRWNLEEAVHGLLTDNSNYYVVAYYPTRYKEDGRFQRIEVRSKRPEVRLRARPGYFRRSPKSSAANPLAVLEGNGLSGGDLRARASASLMSVTAKTASLLVTLDVDEAAWEGTLAKSGDLGWIAVDPDARVLARGISQIELGSDHTLRAAGWFSIQTVVEVPRTAKYLRLAFSARHHPSFARLHLPIDVGPRAPRVGPVLIGTGAAPAASAPRRPASTTPTNERSFANGDVLNLFARVLAPRSAVSNAALRLTHGDVTIRTLPLELRAISERAADVLSQLPLEGLRPGEYALDLSVSIDGNTQVSRTTFHVR